MSLEKLKDIEAAALIACHESDHEPPIVKRWLDARAARELAEAQAKKPQDK